MYVFCKKTITMLLLICKNLLNRKEWNFSRMLYEKTLENTIENLSQNEDFNFVGANEKFLLVASDIHDNENFLERLTNIANNPKCIAFLYAGDLNIENYFICNLLRYRNFTFIPVLGNCDNPWSWTNANVQTPPLYRTLQYANKTGKFSIYMSHGHLYPYPSCVGLNDEDYEIYITGHTHKGSLETVLLDNNSILGSNEGDSCEERNKENSNTKKSVLLFNPGSVSSPRGGTKPSYGLIRIPQEGSVFVELRDFINNALLSKVPVVL